jgi:hypothetical protein
MPRKISKDKIILLEKAFELYVQNKSTNYFELSQQFNLPYSTLRRFIINKMKEFDIENNRKFIEFPYEGFECLNEGDTFSWYDGGAIFKFVKKEKISDEIFWLAVETKTKTENFFLSETLDTCKRN